MLKHELINAVASQTGYSRDTVRHISDAIRENVLAVARKGGDTMLLGLGKIAVGSRGPKKARNIHTGEDVIVPPRNVILFRPSVALNNAAQGE